jgi:hypothetical protein
VCPQTCFNGYHTCDEILELFPNEVTCPVLEVFGCDCTGCPKCTEQPACRNSCMGGALTCHDVLVYSDWGNCTEFEAHIGCDCTGCQLC